MNNPRIADTNDKNQPPFSLTTLLLLIKFWPKYLMGFQQIRLRVFEWRAFLVVAALISLCVSSNVGPRFLPLPTISDELVASQPEHHGETRSRRSRSEVDSFRVPMMAQTQKRTDREPQQPQPIALLLKRVLVSANDCRILTDCYFASSLPAPPSLSLRFGRAPPLSLKTITH
jgi:hypothetical protein